jgi:hypothetical protein
MFAPQTTAFAAHRKATYAPQRRLWRTANTQTTAFAVTTKEPYD